MPTIFILIFRYTEVHKSSGTITVRSSTTVQRRGGICIIVNNPDDDADSKQYNNLTSCSTYTNYNTDDTDNDDDDDNECSQDDYDSEDVDYDLDVELAHDNTDTDNDCEYVDINTCDGNRPGYSLIVNDTQNQNHMTHMKKLNAHSTLKRNTTNRHPLNDKSRNSKDRKLKMKLLKSSTTAVYVGTDVQVHPTQLRFWQKLLLTQAQQRRRLQRRQQKLQHEYEQRGTMPPPTTTITAAVTSRTMHNASMTKSITSNPNGQHIAGSRSKRFIDFFRRRTSSRDIHRIAGEG